jgi:hypothetical protein
VDGRVAVTVSLGVLGASFAAPFLWHFAMFAMYSWILLQGFTSQGNGMPLDAFSIGLFSFFLAGRLVGMVATAVGGGVVVVAAARALRGDESLVFRAAAIGCAAALLGFGGSVFSFDCVGALVQTVPLVVAVIAGALVSSRARELRDAEDVA